MDIRTEPVAYEDKAVLRRLLQLYLYDMSEFTGEAPDAHGEFAYRFFDHYWTPAIPPDRWPLFIRVDGALAGFALVRQERGVHSMAEFFVMRPFRGRGVGLAAAKLVFARFPGEWEVTQLRTNQAALTFWRRAIGEATGRQFEEFEHAGETGQRFEIR